MNTYLVHVPFNRLLAHRSKLIIVLQLNLWMRRPHLLARYMRTCRDAVLRSRWTGHQQQASRFYIGKMAVVRGDEHVQSVVHRPGDVRKSHTILVNLDRVERIGNVQFFFRVESPSIGKTDFAVIDFYNHCPEEAQSPELRRALGFCVVVRNGDMAPPGQRCCLLLTELSTKMSYLAHDGLLYCAPLLHPKCKQTVIALAPPLADHRTYNLPFSCDAGSCNASQTFPVHDPKQLLQ